MGSLLGSGLTSETKQHGRQPDSTVALRLIQDRMTGPQKMSEFVIVRSAAHTAEDAAYKAYVNELAGEIAGLGDGIVESVATYYQTKDPTLVSKDGHAMLVQVVMAGDLNTAIDNVDELHAVVTAGQGGDFTLQQTGTASLNQMGNELAKSDMERAELFGVPLALVVLVVVFGALLAAFMPLVLSIISIVLALALTGLIGQLYPMNTFVLNILTTMGLAVGIDYTLFIISRYREERARGLEKIDAIAATGATANRAIFFSGMTVVLAMLGMVVVPVDLTISMGIGAMLVVFTTLLTSLILLPAVMGLLGDRVNALRVPFDRPSRRAPRPRPRGRLGAALAQHHAAARDLAGRRRDPAPAGRLAHRVHADRQQRRDRDRLPGRPVRQAGLGHPRPRLLAGQGQPRADRRRRAGGRGGRQAGRRRLQTALEGRRPLRPGAGRREQGRRSHRRLGDRSPATLPARRRRTSSGTCATASCRPPSAPPPHTSTSPARRPASSTTSTSSTTGCRSRSAVVLSLSFVLLLVAFRSIVIPAKAILMNLLSVGAAYGLLVLVFQMGVGADLLGFTQVDSIEAWVPLFLFALLFGLSMDYQVFLLTRIKERFDHTGDTREAVAHGIGRTASIITGAAAIMVCVFGGMATGELVMFQQMGFGLAVAIFLDATIVRTIIVPAGMELLGDWNWYLPRWLEWLPNVSVEGRRPLAGESDGPSRDGRDDGQPEGVPAPQTARVPAFRVPAHAGASAGR